MPGEAGHVCFQYLRVWRNANNEVMNNPIPLEDAPAGRGIQRVTLDPADGPIREVNVDAGLA